VTIFDYTVLLILICSIVISMVRGLLREILSLLGWIVAFFAANAYGEALAGLLPEAIPGKATRLIVGFLLLFIAVKLLTALVNKALDAVIKGAGLSLADKGLGGLFGFARGVLIVMTAVILCGMTAIPQQAFWKDALLSPMAETAARTARPYLPGEFVQYVKF
jgi:membrane protein required for colicin V production